MGVLVDFVVVDDTFEDEVQDDAFVLDDVLVELEILLEDLAIEVLALLVFELILLDVTAILEGFAELELTRVDEITLLVELEVGIDVDSLAESMVVPIVFVGLWRRGHHQGLEVDLAIEVGLELDLLAELDFVVVVLIEELDLLVELILELEFDRTVELSLVVELGFMVELDFIVELDLAVELLLLELDLADVLARELDIDFDEGELLEGSVELRIGVEEALVKGLAEDDALVDETINENGAFVEDITVADLLIEGEVMTDETLLAFDDDETTEDDPGVELGACSSEKLDKSRSTALLGLTTADGLLEVNVELLDVITELE